MALSLDEALGMSLADEADESIHVDVNTRQITIPESQKLFGVESDADVEVKHIVIDGRYADDNRDLSKLTWRVIYRNANKDTSYYLIPSVVANENSIEMDWLIKRSVVAYKGTVDFILCAFATTSSGEVTPEWNSTLGQGIVLEGLETSAIDINKEVVDELAKILYETIKARNAAAKSAADADRTANSINESMTQIAVNEEAIGQLKDGKISKFYASSQGDTNLPDSDDGRIMDLKLYGKSEQKQYSGKNLLDLRSAPGGFGDGVTYTPNGDGSYTRKGTATGANGNVWFLGAYGGTTPLFTLKAGTYTVKDCTIFNGTNIFDGTFTIEDDLPITGVRNIWQGTGESYDDVIYPRLLAGSTDTGWEPYVGGIPSPNPDYPQEIKSVVKPVVKVMGKNLLKTINWETQTVSGVTIEKTSDTVFKISGTATGDVSFNSSWGQNISVPAQSYLLCKILNGSCPVGSKVIFFTSSYDSISSEIGGISPLQTSAISCGLVRFNIKEGSNINCTVGLSLQMDTSTAYEPYHEQSATLPYTLNAIPVTSGGNVTIDGQQYVADYVDVERGKLVRMVARKKLFDLNVLPWGDPTETRADFQVNIERYDSDTFKYRSIPCIVSSLSRDSKIEFPSFSYSTTNDSGWGGYARLAIYVSKDYDTVDKLKSYLGEDTVILYQPKDLTETDLTTDEIAAFKFLVSYYPVTNVSTTSDQLDGYTVFNYPISLANGWNYVKQQLGDTRDYLYGIDLMTAEAYVNSEYAAALAEIEV